MLNNLKIELNNKDKKINRLLPFFIILLFIILNVTIIFNLYNKNNQKKDILRLHVLANSNSIKDQITKLKVYEKVNNYISNINQGHNLSKKEIIENITNNASNIINISNETIKDNNEEYLSKLNIGKIYYDEKESILVGMGKGTYDSIELVLGEGNGKNIWSLIAPSKENIDNIKKLDSILPGINSLYSNEKELDINNSNATEEEIKYDIKILEIIDRFKASYFN